MTRPAPLFFGGVAGLPFQEPVLVPGDLSGPHLPLVAGGAVGVAPALDEDSGAGEHEPRVPDQGFRAGDGGRVGGDGDGMPLCRHEVVAVEVAPRHQLRPRGRGAVCLRSAGLVDDLALDHHRGLGAGVGVVVVGPVVQGDDRRQLVP
ncbi:hypothetical protein [Pseudonocardia sp. ICBG1142]|uniref:hypothetical protein n=1 Tax=Pseudonocardia sp. ICBG1142 TaxID=2846760 RepID=UPI001CF66F68|nr:hypothetical protein [Pseudonocardia sp. ICBG1142]